MDISNCEILGEHGNVKLRKLPDGEGFAFEMTLPWAPNNVWHASFIKLTDWEKAARNLVDMVTDSAMHQCLMLYAGEAQK